MGQVEPVKQLSEMSVLVSTPRQQIWPLLQSVFCSHVITVLVSDADERQATVFASQVAVGVPVFGVTSQHSFPALTLQDMPPQST